VTLVRQRREDGIADGFDGTPSNEGDSRDASTPSEPAAQTPSAFLRVIGERFSL
jgi:hypothetical protein